jgi:hypothetical protein
MPGPKEEDDRCLYVRTVWGDDIISDLCDVYEFKAA